MILAGFDIASRTGAAIDDGKTIRARTFKSKAKRPFGLKPTEISQEQEAEIEEEFRDWVRALLVAEGVTAVGYEKPADRTFERTKTVVDTEAEWAGQAIRKEVTNSSSPLVLIRAHRLVGTLVGVSRRLNIPRHEIPAGEWRKSLIGMARAPRSAEDGRKYLKEAVRQQCKRLGIDVKNDDEGDAIGVVFHLRGLLNPYKFRQANSLFDLPPSGAAAPTGAPA